jgi:hypothetical protein
VKATFESPMTIANMRRNGLHAVIAACQACGHKADVNVDGLPETRGPRDRPTTPMQPVRREADPYETGLADNMTR